MRQSILEMAGLPPPFGITLLGLGLILTLSPYLGGADFGLFKVPTFSPSSQNRLKIFGPLALIAAISLHVPSFLKTSPAVMAPPAESTAKPDTTAVNELFVGAITYSGDVSGIDFSPTGTLIATGGGNDHTAILWNASTGKQQRLLAGDSVVSMVAFNSDGTQLATNSDLFDVDSGERIASSKLLRGGYDTKFSRDGRFLAIASGYEPILGTNLVDLSTGLNRLISNEYASSLAFSADSKVLATATGYLAKGVRLWNLETFELVRTLDGPSKHVAFSSDGRFVATAGDGTVRLFRRLTGEQLRDIKGDIVTFSPDGRVLATAGADKKVRLHDPANGNLIRTLEIYANELVFSPDGVRIATVGPDRSINVSKVQ